ncbi:hypothetical protein O181_106649, partial [Austropuccinia psidii MF-1]|nr:hypothetical protein [Austropuccinia psidii MF-1]
HPITQEGGREALFECALWVQCTSAPCRNAPGAFGHQLPWQEYWPYDLVIVFEQGGGCDTSEYRVIHRQLSHSWKTFYCQSSDWLFSWSDGQLDCRCSPARTWKPGANQCGFASASSALE